MRTTIVFIALLFISNFLNAQELTGAELLDKSIQFHDPENNWGSFKGNFTITMQIPDENDRVSAISMDFDKQLFTLEVEKGNDNYAYELVKDSCTIRLNNSEDISEEDKKRLRLNCERGNMYKDYYTYLYGLPMKLKDPGTLIHEKVQRKTFKGKEYLVLKATYEKEVGEDIWYFYFDPTTYAMEVYQFFHDEAKNDGEYILLEGLETVNQIKMPKFRKWFYNKDDKYLGTDILD